MKYFTADLHLGDERLFLFPRYYKDTDEMQEAIVKNWNSLITDNDTVYVIGDVAIDKERLNVIKTLNGKKHLIRGNYDERFSDSIFTDVGFESVSHSMGTSVTDGKSTMNVNLVHYPSKAAINEFNLVGHIHGAWRVQKNMLNIGVDAWHMRPVSEAEVVFMFTAIDRFYDDDVWVHNHPSNKAHDYRGKEGAAAAGSLNESKLKNLIRK